MDQRVQEIEAEADPDDQTDDGLGHGVSPYNRLQASA
jgi:hypothetical protein